jgi:hypothetical protein
VNHTVWNPSSGHGARPEQRPPAPAAVSSDGSVNGGLWAASEGPSRTEVGGAGGEPEGDSVPIRRVSWD